MDDSDLFRCTIEDHPADLSPSELEKRVNQKRFNALIEKGYENSWTLQKLLDSDVEDTWIVENVIADRQPGVIAGASKSLKTTIATNLALSVASGSPFLGKFKVPQRRKVLFCSAESGKSVTKKTILGMAVAMGIDVNELSEVGTLELCWWVPRQSDVNMMDFFLSIIDATSASLIIIDPTYKSLDDNSASLILTGQQLDDLNTAILKHGSTGIFVDHVKRSSHNARAKDPLNLEDISGAGKAEFFRQWMLIGRREEYNPESGHRLWVSIGGSAGHSSVFGLDVHEKNADIKTREYRLDPLKTVSEVKEGVKLDEIGKYENAKVRIATLVFGQSRDTPKLKKTIQEAMGVGRTLQMDYFDDMVGDGFLSVRPGAAVDGANRVKDGYVMVDCFEDESDLFS